MRMTESGNSRVYDLWARVYDRTFGRLVHRRQIIALKQLRLSPGDRVLDIGVGTGLSLLEYPADVRVVGLDLSEGMLLKAADKTRREGLDHCTLVRADAMLPPFADASFDHIIISHTISVVSDPARLLAWATRLVKPEGRIVVLNHFRSGNPFIAWWEDRVNPICTRIGWRSDLCLEECLDGVAVDVSYRFKLNTIDFWQIVVLRHADAPRHAAPPAAQPMDEPLPAPSQSKTRLAVDLP